MRLPKSKAIHLSRLPGRMFPGRLAEAYDGVGQYVAVILSHGSTAVAYKARVAAGDFGGGRTFPAGTPIHLVSYRGKLEAHLGNQPRFCEENFNQPFVNGWGDSAFPSIDGWRFENGVPGDDWYRDGDPEYFSVENGLGIINTYPYQNEDSAIWFFPKGNPDTFQLPAEFLIRFFAETPDPASLNFGAQIDFYLTDTEKVGSIGSLGNSVFWTFLRSRFSQTTEFYVDSFGNWNWPGNVEQEIILPDGDSYWNQWLRVRFKFDNLGLFAKIWKETDPEPVDWMVWADFPNGIEPQWQGLQQMLIWGYTTDTSPPFTLHPTRYMFDYIKDINRSICRMSGPDFVPNFNGPV